MWIGIGTKIVSWVLRALGGPFGGHATLTDDLVSYWALDEENGVRVDVHGSNDLTDINTVGFAAGQNGNAANFVAADGERLESTAAVFNFSQNQSFTITGWFKTAAGDTLNGIFGKWSGGDRAYAALTPAATKPVWRIQNFNDAGNAEVTASNGPVVNDNAWHYIVCWHDAENDLAGISVDDNTANTAAHSAGVAVSADPFQVSGSLGAGVTWNGLQDEVGIWTRVLTAQERTDLYNSGTGLFYGD